MHSFKITALLALVSAAVAVAAPHDACPMKHKRHDGDADVRLTAVDF